MTGVRRVIGRLMALCVVCQLAMPIVGLTVGSTLTSDCSCSHAAQTGICPMHKSAAGSAHCRLRSADGGASIEIVVLPSVLGLTPTSTFVSTSDFAGTRLFTTLATPLDRTVLPDLPPPRV
jgi:hypothetical protein